MSAVKRAWRRGMIGAMLNLTGNPRACVLTEPLWGIPYALYIPYASLYMQALGLSLSEIGYIASLLMVTQVLASVVSGVLTDKLGRRMTVFIVDFACWIVPYVLWMCAQSTPWFLAAALFNGLSRIPMTAWSLLMSEGCEPDTVVQCYSLVQLMAHVAAFFAPLSMIGVNTFGLVPTMRVLYALGTVMMLVKIFVLNRMTTETEMGLIRMRDTRGKSMVSLLWGCRDVFAAMLKDKKVLYALGILSAFQAVSQMNYTFWPLYLVDHIGIAEGSVSMYTTLRSIIMMLSIFIVVPRLRYARFKRPMLISWGLFIASQLALMAGLGLASVLVNVLLEAIAVTVVSPMADSLLMVNAEPVERARILGLVYAITWIAPSIFPAIAGNLMQWTMAAPFLMNLMILLLGAVLTACLARAKEKECEVAA